MTSSDTFSRALDLQRRGEYSAASLAYHKILESEPDNRPALINLGVTHFASGSYAEAVAVFRSVLSLTPDDSDTLYNLGRTYLETQEDHKALDCFTQAMQIVPQDRQIQTAFAKAKFRLGEIEEARAVLLKLIGEDPTDHRVLLLYANCLFAQKKYASCIVCLKPIVDQDLGNQEAWTLLSDCYELDGQIEKAVVAIKRLILISGDSPALHRRLGALYGSINQFAEARRAYSKAFSLESQDLRTGPEIHETVVSAPSSHPKILEQNQVLNQSQQFLVHQDSRGALYELQKLNRTYPESLMVIQEMAYIYQCLGELKRAAHFYEKILKREHRHLEARMQLIRISLSYPDAVNGLIYLEETLALFPDVLEVKELAGEFHNHSHNYAKAIAYFTECLEKNHLTPGVYEGLSEAYIATGRGKDAVSLLRDIVEKHDEILPLRMNLARAYLVLGQAKNAGSVLRNARAHFEKNAGLLSLSAQTAIASKKPQKAGEFYKQLSMLSSVERPYYDDYIKSLIYIRDVETAAKRLKDSLRFRHKGFDVIYLDALIQILRKNSYRFSIPWQALWADFSEIMLEKVLEFKALFQGLDLDFVAQHELLIQKMLIRKPEVLKRLRLFLDGLKEDLQAPNLLE